MELGIIHMLWAVLLKINKELQQLIKYHFIKLDCSHIINELRKFIALVSL